MRDRLKKLLDTITDDTNAEARWLNTLSLLEYIGARKIGRTMCREHPSAVVLDHWADETRHAYAFKQLCEMVSGGECDDYLCKEEAINYFQQLDERASTWVSKATGEEDPRQNYLLVTTLVERRAMMVYPLYRAATKSDEVRDEVQAIIVEEQDHRVEIEERAVAYLEERGVDIEAAFAIEEDLFGGLIAKMADELGD
jgi:rubrerythrin